MKSIFIASALVVLFVGAAFAGELGKGTIEVSTSGSFSHSSMSASGTDAGSATNLNWTGEVGYSVTNRIALSGGLLVNHNGASTPNPVEGEPELSGSATQFGPQAGVRFNFTTQSSIVPFVEGRVGMLAYSGDSYDNAKTSLWLPSIGGGMRVLIGETASVNFRGDFVHQTNAGGFEDVTSNDFRFGVGLSIFPSGIASAN